MGAGMTRRAFDRVLLVAVGVVVVLTVVFTARESRMDRCRSQVVTPQTVAPAVVFQP